MRMLACLVMCVPAMGLLALAPAQEPKADVVPATFRAYPTFLPFNRKRARAPVNSLPFSATVAS